jgi:hypothetical protein
MPRLNNRNVMSPASGRSASAACADVWMSSTPAWCSVIAVLRMMKNAMAFENVMPTTVSILMRRRCRRTLDAGGGAAIAATPPRARSATSPAAA